VPQTDDALSAFWDDARRVAAPLPSRLVRSTLPLPRRCVAVQRDGRRVLSPIRGRWCAGAPQSGNSGFTV